MLNKNGFSECKNDQLLALLYKEKEMSKFWSFYPDVGF